MKWYITGDTHGDFTRFRNLDGYKDDTQEVGVIVLGDCAVNWTLDPEHDAGLKRQLRSRYHNFQWYLVRGNHDARPEDVSTMEIIYDYNVCGFVWCEPKYPNIHYFKDGGIYSIDGHTCLVIGGAYSVDKEYRLARGGIWHANEQLNEVERYEILDNIKNFNVDMVLTHTAPISWEPTDLFLPMLDQSKVDKTMELWLDEVRQSITFKIWLFGHYHRDRAERPGVQMMYTAIEELDTIWHRWTDPNGLEWFFPKGPMYYAGR